MVRSSPAMRIPGLRRSLTRSTVSRRAASPSSAKYSHCIGTSTESAAQSPFTVSMLRAGGQSTMTNR